MKKYRHMIYHIQYIYSFFPLQVWLPVTMGASWEGQHFNCRSLCGLIFISQPPQVDVDSDVLISTLADLAGVPLYLASNHSVPRSFSVGSNLYNA